MLCISCGGEMRIARIEQDSRMKADGYEHRTLECVRCQKTERRLAFSGERASWPLEYRWALRSLSAAKQSSILPSRLGRAKQGGDLLGKASRPQTPERKLHFQGGREQISAAVRTIATGRT
jgi:hypothetical protein